jgi:hypothetical protein
MNYFMKSNKPHLFIMLALLATFDSRLATAQGTAFTYQGRLNDSGVPANGKYDLRFTLYDALSVGSLVAGPVTNSPVTVTNGLFVVTLDFGAGVFTGPARWLEVGARSNAVVVDFTVLNPRQQLTPTPYAITAENVDGPVAAGQLTGTVPAGVLSGTYGGALTLNNPGNNFVGNGAGLVNVNALTLDGLGPNNFWQTTGNSGTTAGANFVGTTDNQPLELDVYGVRGLRLEYASRVTDIFPYFFSQAGINVIGGYWGNTISNGVVGGVIAGGGEQAGGGILFQTPYPNTVVDDFGAVGGGYGNTAGTSSAIPGGYFNLATGNGSFAAGRKARTTFDGSFIWSDGTKTNYSSGANSFDINATGGVHINGSDLYLYPFNNTYGLGYRSTFAASTVNGPVLYSYLGGALAGVSPDVIALQWDYSGHVTVNQRLTVLGEFSVVNGLGNEQAYMGGDGVGGDVQFGSLNSAIDNVAFYNAGKNAYMHIYCSSITIEGGADLAEPFKITAGEDEVPQGAVVVIDEQNPGHLKLSDSPYDTRVAGVVSGANGVNPGIQMQQQGILEGGKNVALTGRVYVQADASNGAIRPGDLLTTSTTPGCAMKVSDHLRASGAILGKAMTGLSEGKGMVLVLVTLQ